MPEFTQGEEEEGLIVSLDQEKVYDKIDHEYLWEVLETFGFLKGFMNIIKESKDSHTGKQSDIKSNRSKERGEAKRPNVLPAVQSSNRATSLCPKRVKKA